ncbi:MAG: hypothetical protein QMD09_00915 [Desulfatibacillaceae bacterium]|nr:hypothetical protein [Desulfatibacillaceae bacterium]
MQAVFELKNIDPKKPFLQVLSLERLHFLFFYTIQNKNGPAIFRPLAQAGVADMHQLMVVIEK